MDGATLGAVLGVIGTVLGGVGTFLGYRYMRVRDASQDLQAETRASEESRADQAAVRTLAQTANDTAEDARSDVRSLRSEVTEQGSRVSVLESKMEVFWRNVAFDVSKILHSPHPGWEDLDTLLEKFQARAISDEEMQELEDQLRDMVEGRWDPAPVARADQVAASLLLRAIEQTRD